jgi:hypothetical protein
VSSASGGRGQITVKLACPKAGLTCSVTVTATVNTVKHAVASAAIKISPGKTKSLTLKLNSSSKKLLARLHKLTVRVSVKSGGRTVTKTVRVT